MYDTSRGFISKCLTHELLKSMNQMIKVVNYIKGNAFRCRIFSSLCESMDAQFKCLLFHTEVRWISKGKVLTRFICLKEEIISFLNDTESDFHFIISELWWLRITF